MKTFLAAAVLLSATGTHAADGLLVTPFLQQGAMALLSEEVTAGGFGGGIGAQALWRSKYLAQLDVNVLWAAGNSFVIRAAAGYQRKGAWAPAAWGTLNLLTGDRIERLSEDGRRPPRPTWAVGARLSPLRFSGSPGFLSAFELGVARPSEGGWWVELMVLQAGAPF